MTQHNIIGHERPGDHVVIRQFKPARRQTVFGQFLSAVGGVTIIAIMLCVLWAVMQ